MALERVAFCYSLPETLVLTSMLEAYGIPVTHIGLNHCQIHWTAIFALGGIGLLVPASKAEAARDLVWPTYTNPAGLWETGLFWGRRLPWNIAAIVVCILVGLPFLQFWVRHWRTRHVSGEDLAA